MRRFKIRRRRWAGCATTRLCFILIPRASASAARRPGPSQRCWKPTTIRRPTRAGCRAGFSWQHVRHRGNHSRGRRTRICRPRHGRYDRAVQRRPGRRQSIECRRRVPQPGLGHTVDFTQINNGNTLLQNNINFLANHLLVPEPSSLLLASIGMLAWLAFARRIRRTLASGR